MCNTEKEFFFKNIHKRKLDYHPTSVALFRTIYGSCVLKASSPHSLHHSHNNQLFPCVALKFHTLWLPLMT